MLERHPEAILNRERLLGYVWLDTPWKELYARAADREFRVLPEEFSA